MTNKKYKLDVCIPRYVNKANTKLDTYTRQFEEAQSITDYFREITPVQILADDVGTGKTWVAMMVIFSQLALSGIDGVQTKRKKRKHAVVIAPTRMVANKWVRELNYFNRIFVKDSCFSSSKSSNASAIFEILIRISSALSFSESK